MKLYKEGIINYQPWSGAVDRWQEIVDAGKVDELENLLDELYPDGMSETQLNDIIWFEEDWYKPLLGMECDEDEDED